MLDCTFLQCSYERQLVLPQKKGPIGAKSPSEISGLLFKRWEQNQLLQKNLEEDRDLATAKRVCHVQTSGDKQDKERDEIDPVTMDRGHRR